MSDDHLVGHYGHTGRGCERCAAYALAAAARRGDVSLQVAGKNHGHRWRQNVWGVLGVDRCARWRCNARRVNPDALPPLLLEGHTNGHTCDRGSPHKSEG